MTTPTYRELTGEAELRQRPGFGPGDFLDAARALAGDLSAEAHAALAAAWPADAPPPAVVAHLLAVMLADVAAAADAEVSKGFIRARHQKQTLPPKAPPRTAV